MTFFFSFQNDKDKSNIVTLINAIKESKGGTKIGVFGKDKFNSELIDAWRKAVKEAEFEQVKIHSFCKMKQTDLCLFIIL